MKTTHKKFNISGRDVEVWSVKHLAEALNRSAQSVVVWEKNGRFPRPLIKTADGARWYTRAEIQAYGSLAVTYGLGARTSSEAFHRAAFDVNVRLMSQFKDYLKTGVVSDD